MKEIEKEINERVSFKLNDIYSQIENRISFSWAVWLKSGDQKFVNKWQWLLEIKEVFEKEIWMSFPYDRMYDVKKNEAKNIAVEKIMNLCPRWYWAPLPVNEIVKIIEECQV